MPANLTMPELTCGTCRHWRPGEENEHIDARPDWGVCAKVVFDIDDNVRDRRKDPAVLACVTDGSGYYAALLSRSTFGCRLYAPATPSSPSPP